MFDKVSWKNAHHVAAHSQIDKLLLGFMRSEEEFVSANQLGFMFRHGLITYAPLDKVIAMNFKDMNGVRRILISNHGRYERRGYLTVREQAKSILHEWAALSGYLHEENLAL